MPTMMWSFCNMATSFGSACTKSFTLRASPSLASTALEVGAPALFSSSMESSSTIAWKDSKQNPSLACFSFCRAYSATRTQNLPKHISPSTRSAAFWHDCQPLASKSSMVLVEILPFSLSKSDLNTNLEIPSWCLFELKIVARSAMRRKFSWHPGNLKL